MTADLLRDLARANENGPAEVFHHQSRAGSGIWTLPCTGRWRPKEQEITPLIGENIRDFLHFFKASLRKGGFHAHLARLPSCPFLRSNPVWPDRTCVRRAALALSRTTKGGAA